MKVDFLGVPTVIVHEPTPITVPMVFDSPHSGRYFPDDAQVAAPASALSTSWDAYVDELWDVVPKAGGILVEAGFHRTYIDVNRSRLDIDEELLDCPWPGEVKPTASSKRGMGLIRRYALPEVPMYERKLTVPEIQNRLTRYYDVYHDALKAAIEKCHTQFGHVWHINCHSMKSVGNAMNIDSGQARPDIVVSDRDGTTSSAEFTAWVVKQLRGLGYRVNVNDPYKGAEIVRLYGAPEQRRHSVQIELNRSLYMRESTCQKHEGFVKLRDDLRAFVLMLRDYAHQRAGTAG